MISQGIKIKRPIQHYYINIVFFLFNLSKSILMIGLLRKLSNNVKLMGNMMIFQGFSFSMKNRHLNTSESLFLIAYSFKQGTKLRKYRSKYWRYFGYWWRSIGYPPSIVGWKKYRPFITDFVKIWTIYRIFANISTIFMILTDISATY